MFTKLIFTVGNKRIEFHLHEIVQIALRLSLAQADEASKTEDVFIPFNTVFNQFINSQLKTGNNSDDDVIAGKIDKYLLIPMHINNINTPGKWLHVAKKLRENYHYESMRGWWIKIADRLLFIKNKYNGYKLNITCGNKNTIDKIKKKYRKAKNLKENFLLYKRNTDNLWFIYGENYEDKRGDYEITDFISRLQETLSSNNFDDFEDQILEEVLSNRCLGHSQLFYVSDHGFISDVVEHVRKIVFEHPWTNPSYVSVLAKSLVCLNSLSTPDTAKFKSELAQSILSTTISELKEWHLDTPEEELKKMQSSWIDEIHVDDNWQEMKETVNYTIQVLFKKYYELKFDLTPGFDDKIYNDPYLTNSEADALIRRVVLTALATDMNIGKCEPLFRPVYSYGKNRYKGDTYHDFARSIERYFSSKTHLTPQELAAKMRHILKGGTIETDDLAFLPNLIGAWFIAELVRNPTSLLSGLMLIDMIENCIELSDNQGNNWYSWQNTLIHPLKKDSALSVVNLYGNKIDIDRFGGSHPMAHSGSVNDTQYPPSPDRKLSIARQKEGSIILHWLYKKISLKNPEYQIQIISTQEEKPVLAPKYNEIDIPSANSNDLTSVVKKIQKLNATIRVKQKSDIHANVDDELKKISELEIKKSILICKHELQKKIIEPLLKERLSTLDNLLTPTHGFSVNNHTHREPTSFNETTICGNSQLSSSYILKKIAPDEQAQVNDISKYVKNESSIFPHREEKGEPSIFALNHNNDSYIKEHRHESPQNQAIYDKRYGLILRK